MKLIPEMIPQTSFFVNVRSMVSSAQWDILRKGCYKNAQYKCEICGGIGKKHPVECHEVWQYDNDTAIQKLVRLIALCPACHEVVHIGLAGVRGRTQQAISHMIKVNGITKQQAEQLIDQSWQLWQQRNTIEWVLDITILEANK